MPTTADAPERETAWLVKNDDALPSLLVADGGPWEIIQARWNRTPAARKSRIFVLRMETDDERFANQRIMPHYGLELRLYWPGPGAGGKAEDSQRDFDAAIELLLQRIRGFPGNKSHASAAGSFTSVGENPRHVIVRYDDPEKTLTERSELSAKCMYAADDLEING